MINTPSDPARITLTAMAVTPPLRTLPVIEEKHPETIRQNEYQRYLQSPRWRNLSLAVRLRAKGKCEICRRRDGVECAHLTYDRIFYEPIEDLLWLCKKCHRELDQGR